MRLDKILVAGMTRQAWENDKTWGRNLGNGLSSFAPPMQEMYGMPYWKMSEVAQDREIDRGNAKIDAGCANLETERLKVECQMR